MGCGTLAQLPQLYRIAGQKGANEAPGTPGKRQGEGEMWSFRRNDRAISQLRPAGCR